MQLRTLLPFLLAAVPFAFAEEAASSVVAEAAASEAVESEAPKKPMPTEVTWETTYLPPDCTVKTKQYDLLRITYVGKLWSTGTKFDANVDRDAPYAFTLGIGQALEGLDEGSYGMCEGEKRSITIPWQKGYGSRGLGYVIPSYAPLIFDIELVKLISRNPMPKGEPAKEEAPKEEAPKEEEKTQEKVKDEL